MQSRNKISTQKIRPENIRERPDGPVRLNRFLAQCGLGSRRECEQYIVGGSVTVNGQAVTNLSTRVDSRTDTVTCNGAVVTPGSSFEYLAFHKPRGCLSSQSDPRQRKTIYDVIREVNDRNVSHLQYIGRLDRDSEGLLLLTNDGDLNHALTHPRYHIKKVYLVKVERPLTEDEIQRLRDGVESEGQMLTAGDIIPRPDINQKEFWYDIVLYEGKNRQIRRMFESCDIKISRLRRTRFASVKLGTLARGKYRALSEREIRALKSAGYPSAKKAKKKRKPS